MQKKTLDYDNVFKTIKMKHKGLFISVINETFGELSDGCEQDSFSEKRQAFLHMEELKKKYPFPPPNYDYEQIRKEAMEDDNE